MTEIDNRIEESKNWFERFMEKIPGYKGYKKKELGREADKIERVFVAEKLDSCLVVLDELKLEVAKGGHLETLNDIDVAMRKLRRVADRVRFADYGYAGMFDTTKADAQTIAELRAFDQGLETEAAGIRDLAAALGAASVSLAADLKLLSDRIEALDTRFSERDNLITGAGR